MHVQPDVFSNFKLLLPAPQIFTLNPPLWDSKKYKKNPPSTTWLVDFQTNWTLKVTWKQAVNDKETFAELLPTLSKVSIWMWFGAGSSGNRKNDTIENISFKSYSWYYICRRTHIYIYIQCSMWYIYIYIYELGLTNHKKDFLCPKSTTPKVDHFRVWWDFRTDQVTAVVTPKNMVGRFLMIFVSTVLYTLEH